MNRAAALALIAVLCSSSCGTPPPRCTTTSCSGCCANDVCLDGIVDYACGKGGVTCTSCDAAQRCVAGACTTSANGGGAAGGTAGGSAGGSAGGAAGGSSGGAAGGSAGGTARLCDFDYAVTTAPAQQVCTLGTFKGPTGIMHLKEFADGGVTLALDAGTLRGSRTTTGALSLTGTTLYKTAAGANVMVMNTLSAQLPDCASWSGRWQQTFQALCTLTWDAGALAQ